MEILVGESEEVFKAHQGLLSSKGDFFAAAFDGAFQEANSKQLTLPEVRPRTFQRFLLWCYSGKVMDEGEAYGVDANADTVNVDELMDLCFFADYLGCDQLQNDVVDCVLEGLESPEDGLHLPSPSHIYEKTAAESPLRTLALHLWSRRVDWNVCARESQGYECRQKLFPPKFLFDLAATFYHLVQGIPGTADRDLRKHRCDYHVHRKGERHCEGLRSGDPGAAADDSLRQYRKHVEYHRQAVKTATFE